MWLFYSSICYYSQHRLAGKKAKKRITTVKKQDHQQEANAQAGMTCRT
jgi:hypothetical protein